MAGQRPRRPGAERNRTLEPAHVLLPVAAVLLAAALAGCVGGGQGAGSGPADAPDDADGSAQPQAAGDGAEDGDGGGTSQPEAEGDGGGSPRDATPDGPAFLPPVNVSTEDAGTEPVLATASDGTVFVQGIGSGNNLWRSADGGSTWTDTTPPVVANATSLDGYVAVGHDDTVYLANSDAGRLTILRSPDLGETWIPLAPPPVTEPMHRMWVVPTGDATLHVLAESLRQPHVWYMRSPDMGDTWSMVGLVDGPTHFGSDLAVGPEGTVYNVRLDDAYGQGRLPASNGGACATDSGWVLYASDDGGLSWETTRMFSSGAPGCDALASSWQSLEVDREGNLYFLWSWQRNGTSQVHLSVSTDGGESWSTPQPIVPDRGAQALPWSAVRSPGELGVLWYGAPAQGDTEDVEGPWYVDYARISDATSTDFSVQVTRVTPTPVHETNICTKGPQCEGGESRELADFTWVEFGPDGRAHLAFAATAWGSDEPTPAYAVQSSPLELE